MPASLRPLLSETDPFFSESRSQLLATLVLETSGLVAQARRHEFRSARLPEASPVENDPHFSESGSELLTAPATEHHGRAPPQARPSTASRTFVASYDRLRIIASIVFSLPDTREGPALVKGVVQPTLLPRSPVHPFSRLLRTSRSLL